MPWPGCDRLDAGAQSDGSQRPSSTLPEFLRKVRNGTPEKGMQAWDKLLDDKQITQLYYYVTARADKVLPPGRPDEVGPRGGRWVPPDGLAKVQIEVAGRKFFLRTGRGEFGNWTNPASQISQIPKSEISDWTARAARRLDGGCDENSLLVQLLEYDTKLMNKVGAASAARASYLVAFIEEVDSHPCLPRNFLCTTLVCVERAC